jgi:hypothetical protein
MRLTAIVVLLAFMLSCQSGVKYPDGGYEYVKNYNMEDTGFYFLPVKDSFSTFDSFWIAFHGEFLYSKLGEPNLSLEPRPSDVYRLITYTEPKAPIIITISMNKVITKICHGYLTPCPFDTTKLTSLEKRHFAILERRFPLSKDDLPERSWHYYDSFLQVHPELLNPRYYYSLLRKVYCDNVGYLYTTDTVRITPKQFRTFSQTIDRLGYWKMPVKTGCDGSDCTHSSPFLFEANTRSKYKYVSSISCCRDSLSLSFARICQAAVNLAGLKEKVSIYHDRTTDAVIDSIQ